MADAAIKLVLVGNGSVGKSSLIARFVEDGFTRVYKQTIGLDFFEKKLQFPRGQRLVLQVWDVGGQALNSKMLAKCFFGMHVVLLCYDVTDAQSFGDAEDWLRVVRQHASNGSTLLYLAGNKVDLIAQRVVTSEQHDAFVRRHQLHGGFLLSARTGDNVIKTVYAVSAAAAKIPISDFDLSFCDTVIRATVIAGREEDDARTAMADQIEAEDRALEQRKTHKHAHAPHCTIQ